MIANTKSGIKNGLWPWRIVANRAKGGGERGWLYADNNNKQMKASAMEDSFFEILEFIQHELSLIDSTVDMREEYGIYRSLRQG